VTDANMRLVDSAAAADNNVLSIQSGTTGRAGVTFGDSADGDRGSIRYQNVSGDTNEYLLFSVGGAEKVRILQDGKVGIGTGSPAQKLTVNDGNMLLTASVPSFQISGTEASGGAWNLTENAGSFYILEVTGGAARLYLKAGGNVGIGTTNPGHKLEVNGSFKTGGGDFELDDAGGIDTTAVRVFSNLGNLYLQSGNGNNIYFRNKSGTLRAVIQDGGNVGVGIQTPTSLFHVVGAQPASSPGSGTAATQVVQIMGGKGGDTTGTTGQTGGTGADVNLTAGAGGNAPSGSTNGNGGSIALQGGAPGAGMGAAGGYGHVLLALAGGNVGIANDNPTAKLNFAADTTAAGGILFGADTTLYRSAADTLKTDDAFVVGAQLSLASSTTSPIGGSTITPSKSFLLLTPGGAVTLSNTTAISDGSVVGQLLVLKCSQNSVTVPNNANTKLGGGADRTLGANDVLTLIWDGTDWFEIAFANN
jgi:hypothetical protein